MGPAQGHAPAALQDPVYVRHHQYDQGGDSENPTTADENREGDHENTWGGGAARGWEISNKGDFLFSGVLLQGRGVCSGVSWVGEEVSVI